MKILIVIIMIWVALPARGQYLDSAKKGDLEKIGLISFDNAPTIISVPEKYVCLKVDSIIPDVVVFKGLIDTQGTLLNLEFVSYRNQYGQFKGNDHPIDTTVFFRYIKNMTFTPAYLNKKAIKVNSYYLAFELQTKKKNEDTGSRRYKIKSLTKYKIEGK